MKEYHKIQTVFKRDPANNHKTLLLGEYSLPEFEFLKDCNWVFTEKVDGTNIRVMFDGERITFGGKTERASIPAELLNGLNQHFLPLIEVFREKFSDGVCLYGEGYGNKIQKVGKLYGDKQMFILFDVKIGDFWLNRVDVEDVADKLSLERCPHHWPWHPR